MSSHASVAEQERGPLTTVIVTLLLTGFVAVTYGFGFYLFSAIVSDMRADLGFSYTAAGMITASAQIGFLAFALGGGIVAPRIGGGRVVIGSVLLCGTCLVLLPMFDNIWIIGALLTILGGCAASVYVPMVELVSRLIKFKHRGKVLGLVSSGTSYGVFINGLIVPFFIAQDNWRGIWLTVGTGTLILSVLAFITFLRLDLLGNGNGNGNGDEKAGGGFLSSLSREHLSPRNLIIWSITFLNGFALLPFQNYLSPYLRDELGFSVVIASQVWTIIGFIGMGAGFAVGALSDKIGVRVSLALTYVSVLVATLLILFAPAHGTLLLAGVAFALAFYPIFGLVPAYISKTSKGGEATVIFGIANVTLGLGGMLGNFLGGWSKTFSGTFLWVYVAIAGTAILLAILSMILPREGKTEA